MPDSSMICYSEAVQLWISMLLCHSSVSHMLYLSACSSYGVGFHLEESGLILCEGMLPKQCSRMASMCFLREGAEDGTGRCIAIHLEHDFAKFSKGHTDTFN